MNNLNQLTVIIFNGNCCGIWLDCSTLIQYTDYDRECLCVLQNLVIGDWYSQLLLCGTRTKVDGLIRNGEIFPCA